MAGQSTSSAAPRIVGEVELPDPATTLWSSFPRWTKDGSRLVVERWVDTRAWPWLDDHRADVGPALAILGLAVGLWWLVRTIRRPRAVGRRYCRRCNHDVGGTEALSERCPECGRELARRGSVVGRRGLHRLGPALAVAAILVLAGAFITHGSIVGPSSPASGNVGNVVAWPVAALDCFPAWPLWRVIPSIVTGRRLDAVEVGADGQPRLISTSRSVLPVSQAWSLSDDGRWIAWSQFDEENSYRQEILWCNVDTGERGSAIIGTNADGFVRVCGFAPDGRSIVVRRDRLPDGSVRRSADDGTILVEHGVEVVIVDPHSGNFQVVGRADGFGLMQQDGSSTLEPGLVAVAPGPSVRWATFTFSSLRPPAQSPALHRVEWLTVGRSQGQRRVEVHGDPVVFNGETTATIVDDRELVIESASLSSLTPYAIRRYRINLDDGAMVVEEVDAQPRFDTYIQGLPGTPGGWRLGAPPRPESLRLQILSR